MVFIVLSYSKIHQLLKYDLFFYFPSLSVYSLADSIISPMGYQSICPEVGFMWEGCLLSSTRFPMLAGVKWNFQNKFHEQKVQGLCIASLFRFWRKIHVHFSNFNWFFFRSLIMMSQKGPRYENVHFLRHSFYRHKIHTHDKFRLKSVIWWSLIEI